ncbi:MAG: hypothetical protein CMI16_03295 [Opitutaceae bacterium]|nr:hypothetical protein [Opitutaceae bacterium]|tara:strand:- start:1986 stop:3155 length:1170 start_codon:yes stop_codon:yes gene_type:complete
MEAYERAKKAAAAATAGDDRGTHGRRAALRRLCVGAPNDAARRPLWWSTPDMLINTKSTTWQRYLKPNGDTPAMLNEMREEINRLDAALHAYTVERSKHATGSVQRTPYGTQKETICPFLIAPNFEKTVYRTTATQSVRTWLFHQRDNGNLMLRPSSTSTFIVTPAYRYFMLYVHKHSCRVAMFDCKENELYFADDTAVDVFKKENPGLLTTQIAGNAQWKHQKMWLNGSRDLRPGSLDVWWTKKTIPRSSGRASGENRSLDMIDLMRHVSPDKVKNDHAVWDAVAKAHTTSTYTPVSNNTKPEFFAYELPNVDKQNRIIVRAEWDATNKWMLKTTFEDPEKKRPKTLPNDHTSKDFAEFAKKHLTLDKVSETGKWPDDKPKPSWATAP